MGEGPSRPSGTVGRRRWLDQHPEASRGSARDGIEDARPLAGKIRYFNFDSLPEGVPEPPFRWHGHNRSIYSPEQYAAAIQREREAEAARAAREAEGQEPEAEPQEEAREAARGRAIIMKAATALRLELAAHAG